MEQLPARTGDELAEAYRALPSTADDARRYAQRVLDPPPLDRDRELVGLPSVVPPVRTLGLVRSDQVKSIDEAIGANVERYDFSFDPSAIKHVLKNHGNAKVEASRGQRAVTSNDYARLPQLISEADQVVDTGASKTTGRKLVTLVWDRGTEQWEAVFEVRDVKRSLALTTLYIKTRRP